MIKRILYRLGKEAQRGAADVVHSLHVKAQVAVDDWRAVGGQRPSQSKALPPSGQTARFHAEDVATSMSI